MEDDPQLIEGVVDVTEERDSKVFNCPGCNMRLKFRMEVHVRSVRPLDEEESTPKPVVPENPIVTIAKESGAFNAFCEAVRTSNPQTCPTDLEKYFSTWIRGAVKVNTPSFAIRPCLPPEDRKGVLELWRFGNVGAVIQDGALRHFIPYQLVSNKPLPMTLIGSNGQIKKNETSGSLEVWVKTRNGYVVGNGCMFQELKSRVAGEFQL